MCEVSLLRRSNGSFLFLSILLVMSVPHSLTFNEADKVVFLLQKWKGIIRAAIGLQTGGPAEGWHNFYNRDVYWDNNCDIERAAKLSRASIKESVSGFLNDPKAGLFAVVFIGGFLFHIFWEAACEYMLPYFIMIVPYGVMGLKDAMGIIADKAGFRGIKRMSEEG